jgi:hypothetical protein
MGLMPRTGNSLNDPSILEAALEGLEAQRARLDEQIKQVRQLLGTSGGRRAAGRQSGGEAPAPAKSAAAAPRKRRQLSPAARKRIAAAQKKRWAEYRKTKGSEGSE